MLFVIKRMIITECLCAGHLASRLLTHPHFQDGWAELEFYGY